MSDMEGLYMKQEKRKCSVRLSEKELNLIDQYPGKNFSEKVRNLLTVHEMKMDKQEGNDLKEKIEILLKGYFMDYDPLIYTEIEERRNELKKYLEMLKELQELQQLVGEFSSIIRDLCDKSAMYIEQKMADCVMVRKNHGKSKKENNHV